MYMIRTPCEYMMWNGLPVIRKEIATCMINSFGLTQKEAAEQLGVTPAAICQYISKKRGKTKIEIIDGSIIKEITISAERIINNGNGSVTPETCRICSIIRANEKFPLFCQACDSKE